MLLVYLVEEGRHQEDGGLSQKLVDPIPQHWLIEVSVTHKDTRLRHIHSTNYIDLHLFNPMPVHTLIPFIIVVWILFHTDVKPKHQTVSVLKKNQKKFGAHLRHHLWTGIFQLAQKYTTVSEFLKLTKNAQIENLTSRLMGVLHILINTLLFLCDESHIVRLSLGGSQLKICGKNLLNYPRD